MGIRRSWAVQEVGGLGRSFTLSESHKPDSVQISLYDAEERRTQTVILSRKDWEAVIQVTNRYSSDFNWAGLQSNDEEEPQ